MAQNPTIQISVRVDSSHADAVDAYCRYLSQKRHALVSRSDLIRLAISKLPVPKDADPELQRAMARIEGSSWT
jgi:hypothetical protein